jgi:ATP-binding cassette, subfamily B, bacterial
LDNARTLAAFLARLGCQEHAQPIFEECAGNASLDACATVLASRGFDARVVRIRPRDIAVLSLPTLVELDGGDVAILVRARNGVGTVVLGGQKLKLSPASGRSLSGRAIDRSFGTAAGDTTEQALTVRTILTTLWRKDRAVRRTAILFLIYAALLSVVGFASPLLIAVGMDAASTGDVPRTLSLIVVGALLLGCHRSYFSWFRQRSARYLESRMSITVRTALVSRMVRIPLLEAERLAGGSGWQALALVDRVVMGGLGFATTVLWAVFGVGYLAVVFVNLPAAGIALVAVGGILVLVNALVGPRLVEQREAVELASEKQRAELLDMIRGAPASQVAGAQKNGVRRWLGLVIDEGQLDLRRFWAERRLSIAIGTVEQLALGGLLVWCGSRCLDGSLTRGSALAVVQGGTIFLSACTSLAFAMVTSAELRLQARRINDILAIEPLPSVNASRRPLLSPGAAAVELHDVYFRYASDGPWILRKYSLRIEAGQRVVLRWPSGGGKTTLLRIIAGLVRPTHGIVTIGGLSPAYARGLVTYLPQTTYLFSGSVLDNLTVLSGGQTQARLIESAKTTGLADVVGKWPMGLETMVALGGANLSGGERQLIALTAALASDRPIVLLDEALSHVDRLTQAHLTESDLFNGKTVIRVVHEEAMLKASPAVAELATA